MVSSVQSRPNHYETLGLTPAATDREISEAYAARINKYLVPPDKADESFREEARQVMSAYKTLSDPDQRRAYDESLAEASPVESEDPSEAPADEARPFVAAPFVAAAPALASEPSLEAEPISEPEPIPAAEPIAEPEPIPEPEPVSEAQPTPEAEPIEEFEPSSAPTADDAYALREEARWEADADESWAAQARRLPTGAKAAAAALGVGAVAIAALLLSGNPDLTESTRDRSTPEGVRTPAAGPQTAGSATPQQATPGQETPELAEGLATAPSETDSPMPSTAELARSEQAQPAEATVATPSSTEPSGAGQPGDASQAPDQAQATQPSEQAAPPLAAGQPVVSQVLIAPPATPRLRTPPKLVGGEIGDRDNPRGRFQGIVSVEFSVGQNGRVTGCRTVASSGNPALDSRTCSLVNQRLRFSPALDAKGQPVPWTMGATYIWRRERRR